MKSVQIFKTFLNVVMSAEDLFERKWSLLDKDEFNQKIDELSTVLNEYGYDQFGFEPEYVKQVIHIIAFLYYIYFRVEVEGIENVPEGKVLLVANHSGQIPLDAMMVGAAMFLENKKPRVIRSMIERWVPTLPFVSTFMSRVGQVVGTPANCTRLLDKGDAILVFPEGVAGISKTFWHRYKLQNFGRGFMKLAISNETPIVPIAIIGAEEQAPSLYNFKSIAKKLGLPALPITPTFPLIPIIGMLPYPVKYRIYFGEPLYYPKEDYNNIEKIDYYVKNFKADLQSFVNRGLVKRKGIFN